MALQVRNQVNVYGPEEGVGAVPRNCQDEKNDGTAGKR